MPKPLDLTLQYEPDIAGDYARQKIDAEWARKLQEDQARGLGEIPGEPAPAASKSSAPPPSPLVMALEAGGAAAGTGVRNIVDGLLELVGGGPSETVAKVLNVPPGEASADRMQAARKVLLEGLMQLGFSPLTAGFAGIGQALENQAPQIAAQPIADGFAAAGIRGLLEGRAFKSLAPEEQQRFLSPLTVREALEAVGPLLAPSAVGPAAKAGKKLAKAGKEQKGVLLGQRGAVGPEPPPQPAQARAEGPQATPEGIALRETPGRAGEAPPPSGGPAGGAPPPPGGEPGPFVGEARINVGRIEATESVKQTIAAVNAIKGTEKLGEHRKKVGHEATIEASRGKMSLEQALAADPETFVPDKDTGLAVRDLLNRAGTHLDALTTRTLAGDGEAASQMASAFAVAGQLAVLDEAGARNVARGLEMRKIFSEATRAPFDPGALADLAAMLSGVDGGDPLALARRLRSLRTEAQRTSFARQTVGAVRAGIRSLHGLWINMLLTNPATHGANMSGTGLMTLWEIPERYSAEIVHQMFGGGPNGVQRGEAAAAVRGLAEGLSDGIRLAGKTMRGQMEGLSPAEVKLLSQTKVELPRLGAETYGFDPETVMGKALDVLGGVERVTSLPTHLLAIEDAFFKGINFRMEIKALAQREAMAEGLRGPRLAERVAQLEAEPPTSLVSAAVDAALLRTLNADLGPAGQAFMRWANEIPGGRVVLPFIRTPTNIMKWFGQRAPVLNMLSAQNWKDITAGGAARERAIARMALGNAVGAVIAWETVQGNITGEGPADKNLLRDKKATGWQPSSIKAGDRYYAYSRLDPLGAYIGLVASATEIIGQLPELQGDAESGLTRSAQLVEALGLAGAHVMVNKTYLRGLADVLEAIKQPDRSTPRVASGFARSLVPAGVRAVTRRLDDNVIRDARGILSQVKTGIPGHAQDVPPKLNPITGEPLRIPPGWGLDMVSPILVSTRTDDPVLEQVVAQHISIPALPDHVVGSTPQAVPMTEQGTKPGIALSNQEIYRWGVLLTKETTIGGVTQYEALKRLIDSEAYRRSSDYPLDGKALLFKTIHNAYREKALDDLLIEMPDLAALVKARQTERIEGRLPTDNPRSPQNPAGQSRTSQGVNELLRSLGR